MEIREGKYSLKLAQSPADKQQTFCLRHRVFCDELNLSGNSGDFQANAVEFDAYDDLCDHLLVRDENWNCCVATLRFLPGGRVPVGSGFYSEQWFDIGQLSENRSRVLELGRACIDAAYRNTVVFRLLFAGVGAYLRMMPHDYLIGLTTLPAEAKTSLPGISGYLRGNNAINSNFNIRPKKKCDLQSERFDATAICEISQRHILKKMSTLMLAYYKYGAKFVGEPSVDVDFDPPVFDYFTIFDAHQFPAWILPGKHTA
jgi:putative hemolysin